MSIANIKEYHRELEQMIRYSGSRNETTIRQTFYKLLDKYCKAKGFVLATEVAVLGSMGKAVIPDGVIKDSLRADWGYWESKDEKDNLDDEIRAKFNKGYPKDNILFEDSHTAVLIQGEEEMGRVDMKDAAALDRLLQSFLAYERPEIRNFRNAVEQFKENVPQIAEMLRRKIEDLAGSNAQYLKTRDDFWELCKQSINPGITLEDVREMIIQHILTEDIFMRVFDETQYHRENNIANELGKVVRTFFKGEIERETVGKLKESYEVINAHAAGIADHHEKQKFLKVLYETFYKAYNPKGADRLGIVYTPNEIVRFMIESTDKLLWKHFERELGDRNVEILDPATGTGTFITELIDYLPAKQLEYKYRNEIHCNEVAILPYYIANLNIEYTYKQKMGQYAEYPNICFVDTLDNVGFEFAGKQLDIWGLSSENAERIKRQNERKISVIIGNPPYNAKQENYNYQNANKAYKTIDHRIKNSYIKHGTAQNQIVVYDMYVRFFRWASDRLNNDGVLAFVTNNSFVNSRAFDGFRKVAESEFQEIHIIDLKGNARTSGERRRMEGGNIFSDQIRVGVAIYFMVKNSKLNGCKLYYNAIEDYAKAEEKKAYIGGNSFETIAFDRIIPDKKHNWINQSDNDWDELLPLVDKNVKAGKEGNAIFRLYSRGVATQRDEWVYDKDKKALEKKMRYFTEVYQKTLKNADFKDKMSIKWDRELSKYQARNINKEFEKDKMILSMYRPFIKEWLYFDKHFNGMTYQWPSIPFMDNSIICISGIGSNKPFHTISTFQILSLDFLEKTQCIPLYRSDKNGSKKTNITDWGLRQFQTHYSDKEITKEDIFHYTYAALHHPAYREKYAQNLKREFPRLPFYSSFHQWVSWGKALMELHINYEAATPYPLEISQSKTESEQKARLKADREAGAIELAAGHTHIVLKGIPPQAWHYKLGNRSALDWVLDQYKEKKPKDPTIREKFDTYRFADYIDEVSLLLQKVCTVSVESVRICAEMPKEVVHQP